jgi:hypothetical protein
VEPAKPSLFTRLQPVIGGASGQSRPRWSWPCWSSPCCSTGRTPGTA